MPQMRRSSWLIPIAALLFACVPAPTKKPDVAPPPKVVLPPPQAPEKTFGEITYGGVSSLLINYKDITLLVDPLFERNGTALKPYVKKIHPQAKADGAMFTLKRTDAAGLDLANLPSIDYLLLTDVQPHHFGEEARAGLRKDLKIIAPAGLDNDLTKWGYSQVKGLNAGQRVMLKKNEAFLFVSAVQSRNPVSQSPVNGYLLEFDNGRNFFISGEIVNLEPLREFLYTLRDDGKEIYMAAIYGGGLAADGASQSADENLAAEIIALFQPKFAFVTQSASFNGSKANPALLGESLKNQIYNGELLWPSSGDKIPF